MRHVMLPAVVAAIATSATITVLVNALVFSADTAGSAEQVAAGPSGDEDQIQGDTDCDTDVDAVDALGVLVDVAALDPLDQQEPCVDIGDVIPAGQGPPGPPGISGYEIVSRDSVGGPTNPQIEFGVLCPEGKVPLGGGVRADDSVNPTVEWLAPTFDNGDPDGWRVRISRSVLGDDWVPEVYAVCANVAE